MTRKSANSNQRLQCLDNISHFPLLSAILGRRSRRFAKGAEIKSGPFAYKSKKEIEPLSEFERSLILSTMAGNTGWSHLIPFNQKYSPYIPNYAGSAGARTFPSSAGFHTTDLFFTDDSGIYYLSTKDSLPIEHMQMSAEMDVDGWLEQTQKKMKKISSDRMQLPNEEPHVESHNLWVANTPGSLFVIPVADLAQHTILMLCYLLQNGYGITDDINKRPITGLDKFKHLLDLNSLYPITFLDQVCFGEATVELATSCYAGSLLLQAMGLGGWMYDGVNPNSIFGVTGDPKNKGLGFKADTRADWNFPNPTGLPGVFEPKCPPFYSDMREAVMSVVERKYGNQGPFNESTSGPWKNTVSIRKSAAPHSEEFIDCVTLQAQYIYDTFGKFPATTPTAHCLMYLQAFHLDTDFYDHFYKQGAYLHSHANHDQDWH